MAEQGSCQQLAAGEPLDGDNEGIFFLSLCRPEARNSIGRQFLRELRECLHTVAQERTTRCVVVRSTVPGVFCAGADLKERAGMTQAEAATFVGELREAFAHLDSLPMPTVACVDGYALGGGAELALACDIRVCGRDTQFAFPETRLGIIPGAGGTQRLPRIVGKSRAKELIYTGRHAAAAQFMQCSACPCPMPRELQPGIPRIDVHHALRIGLADHAAEESTSEDVALKVAREIALGGPLALRMAKQAVNLGLDMDLHSGMKLEEACYAQVIPTKDRLEGLAAFAEKRQPKFTGE
ncbi:hypothetical protein CHLNCDRAFT_59356 [Chlorella variabilis]|uniref:Enoyl-CoA hydratase n=1 Tax=Chlorella variabilis TaxID=554065 RepID=E1ZT47_CHLVA|nr:hypothetical protein CHLNCDRAFT_59356 [Chlorella variabilis]EFN51053.1 hypothetical protein CHLNCDRAFT_59356 [Chlorella variabilis]|eukprot:XP_005843155.1 hypothetical protein CHLNCDRAFT_59356 [Chlorella variabilis]